MKCPRFARFAKSRSDFFGGPHGGGTKTGRRRPGEHRTEATGSGGKEKRHGIAQRTLGEGERCGRERPAGDGSRRLGEAEEREGCRFDPFPKSS